MALDDSLRTARKVGVLNGPRVFKDSVGPNDKNDYYQFTLTNRSSFKLMLTGLKNNANVSLISDRRVLSQSQKLSKKAEQISNSLEAGTYYIRVYQRQGKTSYKLSLLASALPPTSSPASSPTLLPAASSPPLPALPKGFLSSSSGQVGLVDPATGTFQLLSSANPAFTDLARSSSGSLYGITFNQLYQIDPNTGTSSLIANLGTSYMNGLGFSSSGVLYGTGGSGLYTIDTSTGTTSLVANITSFSSSGDITFDPASNRFWATSGSFGSPDTLYTIALDGTATAIGSIGFSNVYGLFFNSGYLLGYTADGKQITINPTTGAGTLNKTITGVSGGILGAA